MENNRLKEARKAFETAQRCPILIASDRWRLNQVKKMMAYIDEQLH
jgi:hypothetical protein